MFDPSVGIVHARSALKVTTSDPINGDNSMTVCAERYPSGHTEVIITDGDRLARELANLSPVHALALAAAVQAVAGPVVDFTGAAVS